MVTTGLANIIQYFGIPPFWFMPLFVFLLTWSLFWKGLALWMSARKSQKIWFVVFLLVNTLGILEIIYLFLLNRDDKSSNSSAA